MRVFFDDSVARFVRCRRWHPTQKIKNVQGGIELTMHVGASVEIASWVLSFGDKALVFEPESLRAQVAAELRRAVARYEDP